MSWFISIHCKCRQRLILLKCSLSLWVFGGWAAMATLQYCEFRQQNPSLKSLGSSWADLGLIKFGLLICQLLFAHHASKQHCVTDLLVFGSFGLTENHQPPLWTKHFQTCWRLASHPLPCRAKCDTSRCSCLVWLLVAFRPILFPY